MMSVISVTSATRKIPFSFSRARRQRCRCFLRRIRMSSTEHIFVLSGIGTCGSVWFKDCRSLGQLSFVSSCYGMHIPMCFLCRTSFVSLFVYSLTLIYPSLVSWLLIRQGLDSLIYFSIYIQYLRILYSPYNYIFTGGV